MKTIAGMTFEEMKQIVDEKYERQLRQLKEHFGIIEEEKLAHPMQSLTVKKITPKFYRIKPAKKFTRFMQIGKCFQDFLQYLNEGDVFYAEDVRDFFVANHTGIPNKNKAVQNIRHNLFSFARRNKLPIKIVELGDLKGKRTKFAKIAKIAELPK